MHALTAVDGDAQSSRLVVGSSIVDVHSLPVRIVLDSHAVIRANDGSGVLSRGCSARLRTLYDPDLNVDLPQNPAVLVDICATAEDEDLGLDTVTRQALRSRSQGSSKQDELKIWQQIGIRTGWVVHELQSATIVTYRCRQL